jgi:hypothetical protein
MCTNHAERANSLIRDNMAGVLLHKTHGMSVKIRVIKETHGIHLSAYTRERHHLSFEASCVLAISVVMVGDGYYSTIFIDYIADNNRGLWLVNIYARLLNQKPM